ncbi:MAG: hypothetical protein MI717_00015 [Spirochaetales bacterium]|nr:hypothetical protein [Spirochaetales bacterium]
MIQPVLQRPNQALPNTVTDSQLQEALSSMILSASGWRKVFAPSGDHGEETLPSPQDRLLALAMGQVWGNLLHSHKNLSSPITVLVATDTRPTGPELAHMLIRGLLATGCQVHMAGVASAPEAMAHSAMDANIDAFAYISASHNPLGHNGVKFGIGGGVIPGTQAAPLIAIYRQLIHEEGVAQRLMKVASSIDENTLDAIYAQSPLVKAEALAHYRKFLQEIAGGPGDEQAQQNTREALAQALQSNPITVLADLNGSARCTSSDWDYLKDLGVDFQPFNTTPGQVVHAILPEGESLEPCRLALEEAHAKNPSALIGYVPDNDGDRGNLVIWDESIQGARILEAQEVFALSSLAELSCAVWADKEHSPKMALAVNGPTSLRVREIAKAFGAEVHEAEVGEANVVNRAAELRNKGYRVRLLGEGSNGGTITHPAEVRDPLNTLTALIKLLRLPAQANKPSPFEDWCQKSGQDCPKEAPKDCGTLVATLPPYSTTPASAKRALMQIHSPSHGSLKACWEEVFQEQWALHSSSLAKAYGFSCWREVNNEGTTSRVGVGPEQRSGAMTGGLKVIFSTKEGQDVGFLWMRGSGTEPVFRVMAEIKGTQTEAEQLLIEWHRTMVAEADRRACGGSGNAIVMASPVR